MSAQTSTRRQEIVAVAAGLFDEMGYNRTSMEDIAQAVGVAKPTLYHYFSSKEDILVQIHEEYMSLAIDRHLAREESGVAPLEGLREIMVDILQLIDTHRGHVRVFIEHQRELPADRIEALTDNRDRYFGFVTGLLRQAIRDGSIVATDVNLAALALFGMCHWAYTWYDPEGVLTPRDLATRMWEIALHGMAGPRLRG